jgi:hypothetical protein
MFKHTYMHRLARVRFVPIYPFAFGRRSTDYIPCARRVPFPRNSNNFFRFYRRRAHTPILLCFYNNDMRRCNDVMPNGCIPDTMRAMKIESAYSE